MNILYCGDAGIVDGLLISILSLIKNSDEKLAIYIMTMELTQGEKTYHAVSDGTVDFLDGIVRKEDAESFVKKIDITEIFAENAPHANMDTRFTPFCMLRLFADMIADLPDRLLYLDVDVVVRQNISDFYHQELGEHEIAGVLDHYGKWFFRRNPLKFDYLNSGVLILNMKKIKSTKLFERCRNMCRDKKMFMPDQSSLNKLSEYKRILPRKYNEQRKLRRDTVIQHFTTSFRFFPWLHTLTVKPWQVDRVHDELKLHEYDDILEKYEALMPELSKCA
ncbi:MAG: glycosyltransferase family 8 protein [Clostridia bacterium]|nr:glycosyltransferase family 8 protein [Clostridia bacterium]